MKGCFFGKKPPPEIELLLRALDSSDVMELAALYGEARNLFGNKSIMDGINKRMEKVIARDGFPRPTQEPTPEPDCSGGMPCTTCPDKKACQQGCRRQPEFISHEYHDRNDLRAECDAADTLLRGLGLDPDRCRTEGGSLNASRALSLLREPTPEPRPQPLTEEYIKRHSILAADCPGASVVLLASTVRRLAGITTQEPTA